MYRSIFLVVFLLCSMQLLAQKKKQPVNFYEGEAIPAALVRKVKHLTRGDSLEAEKYDRICRWIVRKKRYDVAGFENIRMEKYTLKTIFRKKKLLCREYTVLLEAMCIQAGIECHIAEGYTKGALHYPYKKFYYTDHEWNVARIDKEYRMTDLTWASGYVKPRISFFGRIKMMLKIPYVPKHWKFVKKVDPYYLDMSPDKMIKTHLPVHPMWQLRDNSFSMNYFEREDTLVVPLDSSKIYPYAMRIQHFAGRSTDEKLLIIADEGNAFNPKNNHIKGANYLTYAYHKWKSCFPDKKGLPVPEKARRAPEIIKFSKEAETYLRKFLQDNDRIKQECFDSLGRKNREINSFISGRSQGMSRKVNALASRIKINEQQNKRDDLSIARKEEEKYERTNSEGIYRVRRGKSKVINKDSLELWQSIVKKNDLHIDSLEVVYKKMEERIGLYKQRRQFLWDTILLDAGYKSNALSVAWNLDLNTNNIWLLRIVHKFYDSLSRHQAISEKKLREEEIYYSRFIRRPMDSLIRVAMRKVAKNKSLIVKIKKYNLRSVQEEELFETENKRHRLWYDLSIRNRRYIQANRSEYSSFYEAWGDIVRSERRGFRRYAKVEKTCYLGWLKQERFRHARYRQLGAHGITNCILLYRRAKIFLEDQARLARGRKK